MIYIAGFFVKILSIIVLVMSTITVPIQAKDSFTPVVDAFIKSELKPWASNIDGFVKLKNTCADSEKLIAISKDICNYLMIEDAVYKVKYDNNIMKVETECNYMEGTANISLVNTYNNVNKEYESTIIIEITQNGKPLNINIIGDKLLKCLRKYGANPKIRMSITGYNDGKLLQYDQKLLLKSILLDLKTKKIHSIECDNLVSMSGYTEQILDSVVCDNTKVNINIASRYSSYYDRTYFWLGTPIINIEY